MSQGLWEPFLQSKPLLSDVPGYKKDVSREKEYFYVLVRTLLAPAELTLQQMHLIQVSTSHKRALKTH